MTKNFFNIKASQMYVHPTQRSLGLRKYYLCDSMEKGIRTPKAGQRTTTLLFNKIWQMALGGAITS